MIYIDDIHFILISFSISSSTEETHFIVCKLHVKSFNRNMQAKEKFRGPRASRFSPSRTETGSIGPGYYNLACTDMVHQIAIKPISNLGVAAVESIRFPEVKNIV
jgi:hypothetical protein